jgi:hypothetical protein
MSGEPPARGLWYGIEAFCSKDTREKLSLAVGNCHFKIGLEKYLSYMIEVICKLAAHTFNEPTTATTGG